MAVAQHEKSPGAWREGDNRAGAPVDGERNHRGTFPQTAANSSGCQTERFAQGLADRLLALFGADRETFSDDKFRFDADEVERGPQVTLNELEPCSRRALAVESTTRQGDNHAAAAGQAFRAVLRVVERLSGNR